MYERFDCFEQQYFIYILRDPLLQIYQLITIDKLYLTFVHLISFLYGDLQTGGSYFMSIFTDRKGR